MNLRAPLHTHGLITILEIQVSEVSQSSIILHIFSTVENYE